MLITQGDELAVTHEKREIACTSGIKVAAQFPFQTEMVGRTRDAGFPPGESQRLIHEHAAPPLAIETKTRVLHSTGEFAMLFCQLRFRTNVLTPDRPRQQSIASGPTVFCLGSQMPALPSRQECKESKRMP
ncbi:MAG TPA: hypothetical protein DDZ51_11390 [Planctomycetaceae bacterium]|nr:hypothetical protein [Planctomycetaceae bacterium]